MEEDKDAEVFKIINQDSPQLVRQNLLKKLKINRSAKDEKTGETPLHITIRKGLKQLIKFFASLKFDVDIPDNEGISVRDLLEQQKYAHLKPLCNDLLLSEEERSLAKEEKQSDEKLCEDDKPDERPLKYGDSEHEFVKRKLFTYRTVYRERLLTLIAHRAKLGGYDFQLMENVGEPRIIYDLGFKHVRGSDGKRIGTLVRAVDDPSRSVEDEPLRVTLIRMLRYFLKIKALDAFTDCDIERIIFLSNGDLEPELKSSLSPKSFDDSNSIFYLGRETESYKLDLPKGHDLYNILRYGMDGNLLAKMLLKRILKGETLTLKMKIFQKYHMALARDVIAETRDSFSRNFLENVRLDPEVKKFRSCLVDEFYRMNEVQVEDRERYFVETMRNIKLKLSKGFGKFFELPDLERLDVEELADALVLATRVEYGTTLTLDRARNPFIKKNIDFAAGHVIVREEDKLVFKNEFVSNSYDLPLKIKELRQAMEDRMYRGISIEDLHHYDLIIKDYETCEEAQLVGEEDAKLPNTVTDEDVKNFLQRLTLGLKQPDLFTLKAIVKEELQRVFQIVEPNLLIKIYQKQTLQRINEDGKLLTPESMKSVVDTVASTINNAIVLSLVNYYDEMLDEFDLTYKPSKSILTEPLLQKKKPQNALQAKLEFSIRKALLTLLALDELRNGNLCNVIFTLKDKTVPDGSKEVTLKVFQAEERRNRLLLEITGFKEKDYEKIKEFCNEILGSIDDDKLKRFYALGESCQEFILLRNVNFQGRIIKLKEFVYSKCLHAKINTGHYVSTKEMIFGPLIDNTKLYVPRLFERSVSLTSRLFDNSDEVFAFTSDDPNELRGRFGDVRFGALEGTPGASRVVLDSKNAEKQFDEMVGSAAYDGRNIHWLYYDSDIKLFYWIKSKLGPSSLGLYSASRNIDVCADVKNEEELLDLNHVVILCGDDSSGKSATLNKMSAIIKEKDPIHWVFNIDLSRCKEALKIQLRKECWDEDDTDNDKSKFLSWLIKIYKCHENLKEIPYEYVLKYYIRGGRFSFIFDGFSNLTTYYRERALYVMKGLKHLRPKYYVIATTPSTRWSLEDTFDVEVYNIKPIAPDQDVPFLFVAKSDTNYLKESTTLTTDMKEKCVVSQDLNKPKKLAEHFTKINDVKNENVRTNTDDDHPKEKIRKLN